ncbi:MAG TPA: RNA-binding S4 domain-containing protein [Stellaceae bacterium]|nr:RNA-binding S4 domain-containing protein [Stellaceae bacterium]
MAERATPAFQRLDRWLWCARFAKSRALAAKLCAGGSVSLGEAPVRKAHQSLRVGDRLVLRLGRSERRIEVLALAERRGPAREARTLYAETEPPRAIEAAESWDPLFDDELEADALSSPTGAGRARR